jgi:hypothetical protein
MAWCENKKDEEEELEDESSLVLVLGSMRCVFGRINNGLVLLVFDGVVIVAEVLASE